MAAYNQDKADKFIASYKALSSSGEKKRIFRNALPVLRLALVW